MVEEQPMFLTNLCYTAGEFRRELGGQICAEGVSSRTSLAVTTGGSGLNLFVSAGSAFIQGDDDPDQGMYSVRNDAQVTVTATAANPTNPRIDQVVATVRDSDYGGTDNDWVLQVVPGTPTVGATLVNLTGAAALPDDSIRLAYLLVPATFTGPFVDATHILDARNVFVACGQHTVRSTTWLRGTDQNFGDGAESVLTYPIAATDTALGNDWLTYNAGVITVKRAGVLLVRAGVAWAPHADSNRRRARIAVNGDASVTRAVSVPAVNSGAQRTELGLSAVVVVAAGDTVEVQCVQNSGVSLAVQVASLTITDLGSLVA